MASLRRTGSDDGERFYWTWVSDEGAKGPPAMEEREFFTRRVTTTSHGTTR
jgi:hypothetical protein